MDFYQKGIYSERETDETGEICGRLSSFYDSVRQDYKSMYDRLTAQREAVGQIKAELASATRNTQIGTGQCREALDSVEEKLTQVIDWLSSL